MMTTTPVAIARDLPARRVMRAKLGDTDLAIWRAASGQVQAWENRCPHRGMRLSYGFVRGDSLACAYHGWHYNCDAVCHYIPAHPELEPPATIKPVVFNVLEQDDLLWVSTDGAVQAPKLPGNCIGVRSIELECAASVAISEFSTTALQDESGNDLIARRVSDAPPIISFGNQQLADSVLLLAHLCSASSVVIHIVAHQSWSTEGRVGLSRWCESIRRQAESRALAAALVTQH